MNNKQAVQRFIAGQGGNGPSISTDGHTLTLHGNVIAERLRPYGVRVTLCGWNTVTTRRYLNMLPGVSVWTERRRAYVNGIPVDDDAWIDVRVKGYGKATGEKGDLWVTGAAWKASDGWRGREEPAYGVCGANDTGMWSDSPCRSTTATAEIGRAAAALKAAGIPTRERTYATSNVFCAARYLIAKPRDIERARDIVRPLVADAHLLYLGGE